MPSKELLGDAIKTLAKKASRSLASKKAQPNHENDHEHLKSMDSGHISASRVSLTTTASNNKGDSAGLHKEDDKEPTSTTSLGSVIQVSESHILDLATASFPPVPEGIDLPSLPKPVLIPRLDPGGSIPFARAWATELNDHAIAKEDFVAFIDNLNIVITPNVAFRVLQVTGFAAGLVPYDIAEGIGAALEGIAILGTVAMNYKRTKDYLSLMNEKYFHPRKLHIKVIGTTRLKKLFELDNKDPCLAPLTEDTLELTSQERCLRYLSQYSCELSFDVPAPSPATTTLAKITAWEIKHKVRNADKAARSDRKRAWKRHQKGKKPQTRWNSRGERVRVRSLDWVLVQNLEEWEAQKAEKEAKKGRKREAPAWHKFV
ncbi:hypothetical protein GQX73_g5984 [Xylaria multiplex]|uniref:Uncharacterized protein n=1 Tax=Xylaria multiplex TaxID=323545 RepID=A0A7C8N3Q3_9PEZI|nr:hypothetical protein GQX73_g5984 [Xylaria multiplex]